MDEQKISRDVLGVMVYKRPCAYVSFCVHVKVPCLMWRNRWGWGGVGMFTFLEHAHMSLTSMFDVTEQMGLGWGGVGMFTFLEHAFMAMAPILWQWFVHKFGSSLSKVAQIAFETFAPKKRCPKHACRCGETYKTDTFRWALHKFSV